VPGVNPVIFEVKTPVPVPFIVLLLLIVGSAVEAQHIPLAVTSAPPSSVIFPPDIAVPGVILSLTVIAGTIIGFVLKVTSLP
jgi:hypothetical protein